MKKFLKTTIFGGAIFLLPIVILSLVLHKALELASRGVTPISHGLELEKYGYVSEFGIVTVLGIVSLLVVSFLAGVIARTSIGRRFADWIETSIVGGLPPYRIVKSMAEGYMQVENNTSLKPALVNVEDAWQLGYIVEPISDGWLAVFLPQSPTPFSGNVLYFPTNRVRPLDISMAQAASIVKRLGTGSGDLLNASDLEPIRN